jgi:hypothetical protein
MEYEFENVSNAHIDDDVGGGKQAAVVKQEIPNDHDPDRSGGDRFLRLAPPANRRAQSLNNPRVNSKGR